MFRTRLGIAGVILGLLMFGASALAQQTQPNSNAAAPQQPGARMRQMIMRRMMKRRRAMRGMGGFRQLNLTDQQKQQLRSIRQTQGQGMQAQRQEMLQLMQKRRAGTLTAQDETRAKELRQQLMQSRQGVRTQMMNLLTADQKAQLEEMIKTRRANREKLNPRPLL